MADQKFDVVKVCERLDKSGTGADTLALILDAKDPSGGVTSTNEYQDEEDLIRFLEKHGKTGAADKVRIQFKMEPKYKRKDDPGTQTKSVLKRHQPSTT